MKNADVNLEQLKKNWIEMGYILGMSLPSTSSVNMDKQKTTLDKMRRRYLLIGICVLFWSVMMFPIWFYIDFLPAAYVLPVALSYTVMMVGFGTMILLIRNRVGQINTLEMSVDEVRKMSLQCKKRHLQFVMIGLPTAIIWVIFFIFATLQSQYNVVDAVIVGGLFGGILGITAFRKFMKDYRSLSE